MYTYLSYSREAEQNAIYYNSPPKRHITPVIIIT
jgi:hypothetical protein